MTRLAAGVFAAFAASVAAAGPGWIEVERGGSFPAVERAAYDPLRREVVLDGALRYGPTLSRADFAEVLTAVAASPVVRSRLRDRYETEGALCPDSPALCALRSMALEVDRACGSTFPGVWSLHFYPPDFKAVDGRLTPKGGGMLVERLWGTLPAAPPLASDSARRIVEAISFARGLRRRGVQIAPLVRALEMADAMPRGVESVLVLGFDPYGGRRVNAGAEAAESLRGDERAPITVKRLPVEWDRAAAGALALVDAMDPGFVLIFGEHSGGWFRVETRVANRRYTLLADAAGKRAATETFSPAGPAEYTWAGRPFSLAAALAEKGYPVRISRDPGREQCAGVLYRLAERQTHQPALRFAFVHVPRLGTRLANGAEAQRCSQVLLAAFAGDCLEEILRLEGQTD